MIIYYGILAFLGLFTFMFSILPDLPNFDDGMLSSLTNGVSTLVSNGASILDFFIDLNIVRGCIAVVLTCLAAELIYYISMWIIHKVPFINIH